MVDPAEAEKLIYNWCTCEARGSPSAQALAAVYASTYMDGSRLLRMSNLRVLDDKRLDWALALIRGYVDGVVTIPWARAVALVALYDLFPAEEQPLALEAESPARNGQLRQMP